MTRNMVPARRLEELQPLAKPYLEAMPDRATAGFPERFAELLSTDEFTPTEIAIVLGKMGEYGRVHLLRMRKRLNRERCHDKLGIHPSGLRGD